jgi:protein phosphatase
VAANPPYEVHLINLQTQQRSILQLGAALKQDDPAGSGRSVAFRFVAGDAAQTSAGVLVERVEGGGVLLVDGSPVLTSSPVTQGSTVTINNQQYRVEMTSTEPPPQPPVLRANWLTITGSYRDHNEDAVGVNEQRAAQMYVLCDGVGGAEAGEAVSQFAIQQMLAMFHQHAGKGSPQWLALMNQTLTAINSEVRRQSRLLSERRGANVMMGSTMVCVILQGWDVFVLHVGDSRLYHWRNGQIRQVTTDHSTFMDDIYARMGTGASTMPGVSLKRNVLVKGIGKSDTIEPDLMQFRLLPGDKLLLCSDGMSDKVGMEETGAAMRDMRLEDLPGSLAQLADSRVSKDNISVMVVEASAGASGPAVQPPAQERAYLGYNPRWPKSMDTAVSAALTGSAGGAADSGGRRKWLIGVAALVVVVVLAVIVVGVLAGQNGAAVAEIEPTASSAPAVAMTDEATEAAASETPAPTETPVPTDTPTPTETWTPSPSPVPPTATLRAAPTATVRP